MCPGSPARIGLFAVTGLLPLVPTDARSATFLRRAPELAITVPASAGVGSTVPETIAKSRLSYSVA